MSKKIGRIRIGRRVLQVWRDDDRSIRLWFAGKVIPLTPDQAEQLKNLLERADAEA